MQQNYSQRLEMQIPKENAYIGLTISNNNLKEFLKSNYEFPSDNSNEILDYIREDQNLEEVIYGLPKIISKEFTNSPVLLDFSEFSTPLKPVLEIIIKTPYDGKTTSNKKDIILGEIFRKYPKTTNEYFISMEFIA